MPILIQSCRHKRETIVNSVGLSGSTCHSVHISLSLHLSLSLSLSLSLCVCVCVCVCVEYISTFFHSTDKDSDKSAKIYKPILALGPFGVFY